MNSSDHNYSTNPFSTTSYINSAKSSKVFKSKIHALFASQKSAKLNLKSTDYSIFSPSVQNKNKIGSRVINVKKNITEATKSSILKKTINIEERKKSKLTELLNSINLVTNSKIKDLKFTRKPTLKSKSQAFTSKTYKSIINSIQENEKHNVELDPFLSLMKVKEKKDDKNIFMKVKKERAKNRINYIISRIYAERIEGNKIARTSGDQIQINRTLPSPVLFQTVEDKEKKIYSLGKQKLIKSCNSIDYNFKLKFDVPLKKEAARECKQYQEFWESKKKNHKKRNDSLNSIDLQQKIQKRNDLTERSFKEIRTFSGTIGRIYKKMGIIFGGPLIPNENKGLGGHKLKKSVSFFNIANQNEPIVISCFQSSSISQPTGTESVNDKDILNLISK